MTIFADRPAQGTGWPGDESAQRTHRHTSRMIAASLAMGAAFALSACQSEGPAPSPTTNAPATRTVELGNDTIALTDGQSVRVHIGKVNSSIGDSWTVTDVPTGVAELKSEYTSDCKDSAPGCGGDLSYLVTGAKPGATTVTFQYCFRSAGPECAGGPDNAPNRPPTTITIRVQ